MDTLAIKNFLDSAEFQNALDKILVKHKLPDISLGIKGIFWDILAAKIILLDMPLELISRLEMEEDSAYALSSDLFSLYYESTPKQLLEQMSASPAKEPVTENKDKYDFKKLVGELKIDSGVKIDASMDSRLKNAIINRLRNIRDHQETLDVLTKSPKIGGVGLNQDKADSLLIMLNEKQKELKAQGINIDDLIAANENLPQSVNEEDIDVAAKVSQSVISVPTSQDVTIDQILAQRAQATGRPTQMPKATGFAPQATPFVGEIEAEETFLDNTEELPAPVAPVPPFVAQPIAPQRVVPPPIRPPEIRSSVNRPVDQNNTRPQMSDVKFDPRLTGPVEELAALGLQDFRRLSKDPNQAAAKIRTKLEILEGESVIRKNDGIKALKSSPLYKLYAGIMNTALLESKSFSQVVEEKGDLSLAEFSAIMELNKSLKY